MRWDSLRADLRFAARQVVKAPGFSLVAILTLALGIGANSTIFSVVNSILFRPAGYAGVDRLVDVYTSSPNFRYSTSSYPDYADLRDQSGAIFSGVLTYRFNTLGFSRSDVTLPVWSEAVSGNYFAVLGVPLFLGRGFTAADDLPGAAPVAVLGHSFWRREFSADPKVVGSSIRLNGQTFEIVGVAPADFRGMTRGLDPAVWVAGAGFERMFPGSQFRTARGNRANFIRARLADGVSVERAQGEALTIGRRLAGLYSETNAGRDFVVVPTAGVALNPGIDGLVRAAAVVLLAVPGLVLLITCANLATLLLTRAAGRRREIAVRLALGASRRDVVRQLLAESLVLAGLGGVAGLMVAAWASRALARFHPPIELPLSLDVAIDGRVLGFTILVTALTGILVGLAPAFRAGRVEVVSEMREGTRGAARRSRLQASLVAAQIAVSMVLLIGCGLMVRSLAGTARIDLGFTPEGAATLQVDPQQLGWSTERSRQFYHQLLDRLRSEPGVVAASLANRLPLSLNVSSDQIYVEGRPNEAGRLPEIQQAFVGPDYFAAVGGRLIAGRDLSPADGPDQPGVVVINQSAAGLLWPGQKALGRRLAADDAGRPGRWREVVGVVKDLKAVTVGERPTPQIFYPVFERFDPNLTVVVRSRSAPPEAVVGQIRRAVREIEPAMPVGAGGELAGTVTAALFPLRAGVALLVVLGAVGLVIASIGLYGIIAEGVQQRTRELGIRLALGARVADVLGLVFRDGLVLAGAGGLIGLGLSLAASRLLATWLYGVGPYDPLAFTLAPLTLGSVAVLACWLPARRAARVDPVIALRAE